MMSTPPIGKYMSQVMKINTTPAIAKFPYTLAVAIHTQSLQVFVAEGNPPFYPCPSGLRSEFT
jgi:hypothetical protein